MKESEITDPIIIYVPIAIDANWFAAPDREAQIEQAKGAIEQAGIDGLTSICCMLCQSLEVQDFQVRELAGIEKEEWDSITDD